MSAIEDTRKVMQDFLAPELRAVAVRMDALEKRVDLLDKKFDDKFDFLDRKIDDKFRILDKKVDDAERRSEARHNEVMFAIRQLFDLKGVQDRLSRLEAKELAHPYGGPPESIVQPPVEYRDPSLRSG